MRLISVLKAFLRVSLDLTINSVGQSALPEVICQRAKSQQVSVRSRCVLKGISVPFGTARREMRIVLIAAFNEDFGGDRRKIGIKEGKPHGTFAGQIFTATPRSRQQDAGGNSRIGEVLALQCRAKLE